MESEVKKAEQKEEALRKREEEIRMKEEALKKKEEELRMKEEELKTDGHDERFRPEYIDPFNPEIIHLITLDIINGENRFREMSDNMLRPRERRRLIGAGIRNYGFIQKAYELANTNDARFSSIFDNESLGNCIKNIDDCRTLLVYLDGFQRRVRDSMLVYSDEAFSMALMFYNTVKEMSRRGDADARAIFNLLRPFFRPNGRRTASTEEPTEKQLERDFHDLLHNKKDGELIIKNEQPVMMKGKRTVVDNVHKDKMTFSEDKKGEISD
jgi:hypothetical protein